ncbi:hypothetical protein PMIN02_004067 [Paraphaeosphaeria minitans]
MVKVVGLISFYHSFKFLVDNPNIINDSFGWHLQYLTILGLSISTTCFSIGLLADMTASQQLFTLKNYLALVAAPIEIIISMLYWGLRAIDQELVIPPDLPTPPIMADLGFHLFPTLLLSLDALFLSPPWPTSPMNPRASALSLMTSTFIAFLYWFWIELCYSHNGISSLVFPLNRLSLAHLWLLANVLPQSAMHLSHPPPPGVPSMDFKPLTPKEFYPYPIFALLNTTQRIGLFALSGVAMWAAGAGLRWCYRVVNGIERDNVTVRGEDGKAK